MALDPFGDHINQRVNEWGVFLDKQAKRKYPSDAPTPAPPPEVIADTDNRLVAKDMQIQALQEDRKAQLATELETAWSYVAVFAMTATKLAEGASGSQIHTEFRLDGDRLEEIFSEYEFKREPFQSGVQLTIIRRKDQRPVLTIPITMARRDLL